MKNFKLVWSARSECGPNRKKNEDSIYPSTSGNNQPPVKAAVCDGLGGHVSGVIASKIAAKKYWNFKMIILSLLVWGQL